MTYELAKELTDAGFVKPNELTKTAQWYKGAYFPTLSELIEACGDEFEGIQHGVMTEDDGSRLWYAATYNNKLIESGLTPEEAVALLWLALNKK